MDPHPTPRAVLIDLDGTLVDTAPDLCEAAARMLAELGRPPLALATVAGFIGNGVPTLVARVLAAAGVVAPAQAAAEQRFAAHYTLTNGRHGTLYPGALAGVAALAADGYRLACVTNKPAVFAEALLRAAGLRRYFGAVVAGDTLATMKPSPQPLLHACQLLEVAPRHALMVGDSAIDSAAAAAAGMPAWLVYYGAAPPLAAGTARITSLDQLPAKLRALHGRPHPHPEGIEHDHQSRH